MRSFSNVMVAVVVLAIVLVGAGIVYLYSQMVTPQGQFPNAQGGQNVLMSMPKWLALVNEANDAQENDPERAIKLYEKATAEALSENGDALSVMQSHILFLFGNHRLDEAQKLCQKGVELAKEKQKPALEAWFLDRQANCQQLAYENDGLKKPGLSLVKRALEILPKDDPNAQMIVASLNTTYARIAADLGDFQTADQKNQIAMDWFRVQNLKDGIERCIETKLKILIESGKYKEANEVLIENWQEYPESKNELTRTFRDYVMNEELTTSGIRPKIRQLFLDRKFAEIDELATAARSSKKQFSSGRWYIDSIIRELNSLDKKQSEADWKEHIAIFKDWIKARPDSDTAKIALAEVLNSYAWKARGGGYADTVSDQGWKIFGERLAESYSVLQGTRERPPDWYPVALTVALGESWDDEKYDALFNECRKKYPDYDNIYSMKAWRQQPRWGGEEGQAEKFVEQEAAKRSPADGDVLYAQVTWSLDRRVHDVFQDTDMKWPRCKKGMIELIKRYPDSIGARGELSLLSLWANEPATARSAFAN